MWCGQFDNIQIFGGNCMLLRNDTNLHFLPKAPVGRLKSKSRRTSRFPLSLDLCSSLTTPCSLPLGQVLPGKVRYNESTRLMTVLRRGLATATTPAPPPITASVLLSRHALLTPTPEPLAKAYYAYQTKLRHALSNPLPTDFYFKSGSLALRRYLESEHQVEEKFYGSKIAGPTPDLGEIQPEPPLEEIPRDHWEKADAERGERSLERFPEEEVYFLVQSKGKWTFPSTSLQAGEGLDEAVTSRITGVTGQLGGQGMDTWLVTHKPVGLVRNGEERVSAGNGDGQT